MKKIILIICLIFIMGCVEEEAHTRDQMEGDYVVETLSSQDGPLLSTSRFLNIAHRGASGYAPEHTIASYQMGEEMAADYIEIDLQMTKDGTLIAMHDPDVSRTTNSDGTVKEYELDELKMLDAGSWFNTENPDHAQPVFQYIEIPTLDEILETFGHDANYYIETKSPHLYPSMVEELLRILEKHGFIGTDIPPGQVIIQSFDESSLRDVQELEPSLPLVQLINYQEEAKISEIEINKIKEYAVGIGVNGKALTREYVEQIRQADLLIHPYTVNEKENMQRLINWGVTGMFTNFPDRLNEVLERE